MSHGSTTGLLVRHLPRGLPLPEAAWRSRHRAVLVSLAALTVVVAGWSLADGSVSGVLLGALPMALAGALAARTGAVRRQLSACLAVAALLWGSAAVVQASDGLAEAHYLFFLVVAGAALYQAWGPFAVCALFVLGYHVVHGLADPTAVYAEDAAARYPWIWAAVHAGLIGLGGVIGLAAWTSDERVRTELGDVASRNELLMETLGDGLVAIGGTGLVVRANPTAQALLGGAWEDLVGRPAGELLPGVDEALAEFAATVSREGTPVRRRRWTTETITTVPVEVTVVETRALGDVVAVVTVRDLTSEMRAEDAERRLVTAERLEATQRRDVSGLAAAMRPDRLVIEGIDLGVVYEPAESSPAGGDLYDWFSLPDGTVQFTVVDAMGRGLGATRQALAVTATLRTLTLSGVPLTDLVARADAVMGHADAELVATVVVVRYDPRTGRTRVVSGGHPPALHVHGGSRVCDGEHSRDGRPLLHGKTDYVETYGVPIGYPGAGSDGHADLVLAEGDTLLLYSDGIVEGTRDLVAGLEALAEAAGGLADERPQEMAERLMAELSTVARAEDDCLVLALSRTSVPVSDLPGVVTASPADDGESPELRLPPELSSARLVRRHVVAFAEGHRLDAQVTDALVLVVAELSSNAIAHAETRFSVRLRLLEGQVRGSVRDGSARLPTLRPGRPDGFSGRGLLIVDRLTRAWGVNSGPEDLGKTVWFTLDATTASVEGASG